jgi:hypothetical protein
MSGSIKSYGKGPLDLAGSSMDIHATLNQIILNGVLKSIGVTGCIKANLD